MFLPPTLSPRSLSVCLYLSVSVSLCLPVPSLFLSRSVCLPVFLCIPICVCLSVYLFVCLPLSPSLSVCLSVCLSLSLSPPPPPSLSVCLSVYNMDTCICRSVSQHIFVPASLLQSAICDPPVYSHVCLSIVPNTALSFVQTHHHGELQGGVPGDS